jgi:hypothetical protein
MDAPDTDLAGYPANLKADTGYSAGYPAQYRYYYKKYDTPAISLGQIYECFLSQTLKLGNFFANKQLQYFDLK